MVKFDDIWDAQKVSFFVWDCEEHQAVLVRGIVLAEVEINGQSYALVMTGLDSFRWWDRMDMRYLSAEKCEKAGEEPYFYNSVRTYPQEAFASILEAAYNRKDLCEDEDFDE